MTLVDVESELAIRHCHNRRRPGRSPFLDPNVHCASCRKYGKWYPDPQPNFSALVQEHATSFLAALRIVIAAVLSVGAKVVHATTTLQVKVRPSGSNLMSIRSLDGCMWDRKGLQLPQRHICAQVPSNGNFKHDARTNTPSSCAGLRHSRFDRQNPCVPQHAFDPGH